MIKFFRRLFGLDTEDKGVDHSTPNSNELDVSEKKTFGDYAGYYCIVDSTEEEPSDETFGPYKTFKEMCNDLDLNQSGAYSAFRRNKIYRKTYRFVYVNN